MYYYLHCVNLTNIIKIKSIPHETKKKTEQNQVASETEKEKNRKSHRVRVWRA